MWLSNFRVLSLEHSIDSNSQLNLENSIDSKSQRNLEHSIENTYTKCLVESNSKLCIYTISYFVFQVSMVTVSNTYLQRTRGQRILLGVLINCIDKIFSNVNNQKSAALLSQTLVLQGIRILVFAMDHHQL